MLQRHQRCPRPFFLLLDAPHAQAISGLTDGKLAMLRVALVVCADCATHSGGLDAVRDPEHITDIHLCERILGTALATHGALGGDGNARLNLKSQL